jgi:ABC-2 type transport system permease protein
MNTKNQTPSSNFWLAAFTLCRRELVRFYRQRSRMIGVIGSPLIFWFLIGSGLGGSFRHPNAPPNMNYLEYFFPGTIVLIILFTSIFSTISIIEDRKEGFLQSVVVAPVSRASIALGKILGGTFLALAQALIMLLIAPFIGITMSVLSLLLVILVMFVIAFGLTGLGFLIAWRMDSTQGFHAIMNLFLIPLWLLSGALFPASGASDWLSNVMMVNPLSYGIASLRQALYLSGNVATHELSPLPLSLGITFAFALVTFVASAFIVKRTELA